MLVNYQQQELEKKKMSSNKEKEVEPVFEIEPLVTEIEHPMKRPFEQTLKIEWTIEELIFEQAARMKRIEDLEKEQDAMQTQIDEQQRHVDHNNKMLALPEVKAVVDQEPEYLKAQAKKAQAEAEKDKKIEALNAKFVIKLEELKALSESDEHYIRNGVTLTGPEAKELFDKDWMEIEAELDEEIEKIRVEDMQTEEPIVEDYTRKTNLTKE